MTIIKNFQTTLKLKFYVFAKKMERMECRILIMALSTLVYVIAYRASILIAKYNNLKI